MRSGLVQSLVRQLRRSAKEAGPRRTDADLVHRFAAEHDSEAFAELVQRHGPLVWGVCWRSVANRADAEDAFQATFLVFARNARSIRKPEALGAWLHGVAYRVARRILEGSHAWLERGIISPIEFAGADARLPERRREAAQG